MLVIQETVSLFPFVLLQILGLIIVMIFPQIALFLPNLIYGAP
jgi:TRAP-type mannitol/chloroaromatic compound transport system permease large subunit